MIKINNLNKTYSMGKNNQVQALKNINLEIGEGEFLALVGPSGSGKTTLLNQLGCIDDFDSGDITINGSSIKNKNEEERTVFRREHVGFIFQSYNLIPVLTILENVQFPLSLLRKTQQELEETALKMINEVGLEKYKNRRPTELSGGQQQRVSIARALVKSPSVVLADEPTANLDSENSKNILKLLSELNEKYKVTVIFSTHDKLVMEYAKRLVFLEDGEIKKEESKRIL